jgi:hypothetical protein
VAITDIADLDTGIIANLIIDVPQESLTGISISDIPLDEGGQVSVSWRPIDSDNVDSTSVSGYSIWLQDNNLVYIGNQSILPYDGGQWVHRLAMPATGDTLYRVTAQTLIDSNSTGFNKSKFRIAALSADSLVIALSAVFEGYSVDNLRPLPPLGLSATYIEDTGVQLSWESSLSIDLGEYRVYRGESSEFMPTHVDSFLAFTTDTVYIDISPDSAAPFYRVTALDINGNVSNFTPAIEPDTIIVANAGHTGLPMAYRLYQNFPNPFNPVTTIRFDLPIASYVRILVFDLQAREIRRLIDDWLPVGQHLVRWDGHLNDGRMSSAGVYILRLETPYFVDSRKMVLLK